MTETFKTCSSTAFNNINAPRVVILNNDNKSVNIPGDKIINPSNIELFIKSLKQLVDSNKNGYAFNPKNPISSNSCIINIKKIESMTTYLIIRENNKWIVCHYKTKNIGENDIAVILSTPDKKSKPIPYKIKNSDLTNEFININKHIFDDEKYYNHIFTIRINHPSLNYTQFDKTKPYFRYFICLLAGIHDGNTYISKANPRFTEYERKFKSIKSLDLFEPERKFSLADFKDPYALMSSIYAETSHYGYSITFHNDLDIFGGNNFIFKTKVGDYIHKSWVSKPIKLNIDMVESNIDNVIFMSVYNSIMKPIDFDEFINNFCPYYKQSFIFVSKFMKYVNSCIYEYVVEGKKNCFPKDLKEPLLQKVTLFCNYVKTKTINKFNSKKNFMEYYQIQMFSICERETFISLYFILSEQVMKLLPRESA